jgi:hypothetical protein
VRVNEVESSNGTPGDWAELLNTGTTAVDISGWIVKDNDEGHRSVIPASTSIPAGGFYVVDESALGFGLGAADSVRVFAADGTTLVDSYSWTAHAGTTYGRFPGGNDLRGVRNGLHRHHDIDQGRAERLPSSLAPQRGRVERRRCRGLDRGEEHRHERHGCLGARAAR